MTSVGDDLAHSGEGFRGAVEVQDHAVADAEHGGRVSYVPCAAAASDGDAAVEASYDAASGPIERC